MKRMIIIFCLSVLPFFLYGSEDPADIIKLFGMSGDTSLNKAYPSAAVNKYKYLIYFNMKTYNSIMEVNNYNYNEGGVVNFRLGKISLAGGADAEQFGMGNYTVNRYSGIIAASIKGVDTGLSVNIKKYGYITDYSEPLLNELDTMFLDLTFSGRVGVYKNLSVGVSVNNILNSKSVDGGFADTSDMLICAGYDFIDYGIISAGFERKEGYNNYIISYGIKYNVLYAQLNYDFNTISGSIVLSSELVNKAELKFFGSILYMIELGTVYSGGVNLSY